MYHWILEAKVYVFWQFNITSWGMSQLCYFDLLTLQVIVYAMMFWPINVMSGGMIFWPIYSRWEGEGVNEVGKDKKTGEVRVKVNPKFYRPTEVVRVASLCSVYKIMLSDSDLLNFIERAHFYLFKIKILTLIGIWLGCNCQGKKLKKINPSLILDVSWPRREGGGFFFFKL